MQGKLRLQLILRERSISWTLRSALLPIPKSKLQFFWEEFLPKSTNRRQIPVWWDFLFLDSTTIRYQESSAAQSYLEYTRTWRCKSGLISILFAFAMPFMIQEQQRWQSILSEWIEYHKNPMRWDKYLRFPLFRKKLIPALGFSVEWSIVWFTNIPFSQAQEFYLGDAIPAGFQKSPVKLAISHSYLKQAEYALFKEDYQSSQTKVWLRDYFLEVQNQDGCQESDKYFVYLGSDYSHIEIEEHCLTMKLHRRKTNLDIKIKFINPKLNLGIRKQIMSIDSWKPSGVRLNPGSRLSTLKKILIPADENSESTDKVYLIPAGYYTLDPNLMDLISIEL